MQIIKFGLIVLVGFILQSFLIVDSTQANEVTGYGITIDRLKSESSVIYYFCTDSSVYLLVGS